MIKTLNIGSVPVDINTSAGWFYVYRNQFGRDILPDLMPVIEGVLNAIGDMLQGSPVVEDLLDTADPEKAYVNTDAVIEAMVKIAGLELTTILNIVWAMACNANKDIEAPRDWFNKFDTFPMDEIVPDLAYDIIESTVSSKNVNSLLEKLRQMTEESTSTSSQSQESTEG